MGSINDNLGHINDRSHQRASRREAQSVEALLRQMVVEQQRTNQLLEWLGGVIQAQGRSQA